MKQTELDAARAVHVVFDPYKPPERRTKRSRRCQRGGDVPLSRGAAAG